MRAYFSLLRRAVTFGQGFYCPSGPKRAFHIVCTYLRQFLVFNNNIRNFISNFKFSKHRPSGPMLSISQNVCLSVRGSVRPSVHFLRYRLTVFLPPLPEVGCPIFLEIRNPWGKVMERSGLNYEYFCLKIV